MSVEDLLKIPRENEERRIVDFYYTPMSDREYVTFDCSAGAIPHLISSVEEYRDWLRGFVEHYKQHTKEENPTIQFDKNVMQYEVSINGKVPIRFRVDTSKDVLQFFYRNQHMEEACKLVDSFIDIIWYGPGKIQTQEDVVLSPSAYPHLTRV